MVDKNLLSLVRQKIFVTIFVSTMLSAAIIIPKETNKNLIDSLQRIDGIDWNGFYSTNNINGNLENAIIFSSADILPMVSDLLIVLDPAYCTFEYLSDAIRKGCHLFLPEILNLNVEDRRKLIYLAKEGNTLIQVRNDFIFQPLNKKILSSNNGTCFIEVHQSTSWEEGKLKGKILNNLLLVMLSCGAPFHRVDVFCGTGSIDHPDVINIHINFTNGSTASFTLEFSEQKTTHLMKIFHCKELITFDFGNTRNHFYSQPDNNDCLLAEQIEALIKSIHRNTNPAFSLTEEIEVHLLMEKIKEKFDLHFCDILS
jgi:hypothetical protein